MAGGWQPSALTGRRDRQHQLNSQAPQNPPRLRRNGLMRRAIRLESTRKIHLDKVVTVRHRPCQVKTHLSCLLLSSSTSMTSSFAVIMVYDGHHAISLTNHGKGVCLVIHFHHT